MSGSSKPRNAIVLAPMAGRVYDMGRISAIFKADEEETQARYSVSECGWSPERKVLGAHSHPEDDLFYVIEGVMSLLVGEEWIECSKGSFVLIPGGVTHDFENRSASRAGVLNFSSPTFPAPSNVPQGREKSRPSLRPLKASPACACIEDHSSSQNQTADGRGSPPKVRADSRSAADVSHDNLVAHPGGDFMGELSISVKIAVFTMLVIASSAFAQQTTKVSFKVSPGDSADRSLVKIGLENGKTGIAEIVLIAEASGVRHPLAWVHGSSRNDHDGLFEGDALYNFALGEPALATSDYEARVPFNSTTLNALHLVIVTSDNTVLKRTIQSRSSLQNVRSTFEIDSALLCTPYTVECSGGCGLMTGACCRGETKICIDCVDCKTDCVATDGSCQWGS